jgi:mono/diheme cytochrome c family protein
MGDPEIGHQVATDLCSDCHAVERTGDSLNPGAPPLRTVLTEYPPEWLADDLHNGRTIAFRKMPVFHFGEGHEYDLVAYLRQIQEWPETRPTPRP